MGMIIFVAALAATTGVGVFLTERVDRPRRREMDRLAHERAGAQQEA